MHRTVILPPSTGTESAARRYADSVRKELTTEAKTLGRMRTGGEVWAKIVHDLRGDD
jgi:hypothetical protein